MVFLHEPPGVNFFFSSFLGILQICFQLLLNEEKEIASGYFPQLNLLKATRTTARLHPPLSALSRYFPHAKSTQTLYASNFLSVSLFSLKNNEKLCLLPQVK